MHDTSMPVLVVLVGGDAATHAMLRFLLEQDGHAVAECADAGAVPALPRGAAVALVVVVGAERDGATLAALGEARRAWPRAPLLLLAREIGLNLRRGAFALGVQDVVPFPIDPHDLQARLRGALDSRVSAGGAPPRGGESVRAGGLALNKATREVTGAGGWAARLTRRESALLAALMATPRRVVGHEALVERTWGADDGGERGGANALAVYVRRLRAKLARQGHGHGHGHGHGLRLRRTLGAPPRRGARRRA